MVQRQEHGNGFIVEGEHFKGCMMITVASNVFQASVES